MRFKYVPYCLFLSIVLLAFLACNSNSESSDQSSRGLKDYFEDDFLIGVAINEDQIFERDIKAKNLIPKEFNSITPENIMKSVIIHPEWDKYNFEAADKMAEYCKKNDMFLVGHTLVWHSQLAPFVQKIKSRDSLELYLEQHINTIAKRYDGKVNGWDVLNEALNEDGTYRNSIFYELMGEDYIVKAFQLAQAASPNAELYYNDYNIEQPKKRAGAIRIIKLLQEKGVRIDGVGIQGHWGLKNFPIEEIEKSILEYHALGMKVMITELDLGVLPNPWDFSGADVNTNFEYDPKMNPYKEGLPQEVSDDFTDKYTQLFKLFHKRKDKISRITFWGVSDANTWLNDWPVRGRTNYPLLFDRNYEPKPAYHSIKKLKSNPKPNP
jgi:endo-1,4-beta-xylanase